MIAEDIKLIDELYTLALTNDHGVYLTNLEKFKYFYNNRHIYCHDYDHRITIIVQFLICHERGEIFEYFKSEMIDTLRVMFDEYCFKCGLENKRDINNIEKIKSCLKDYNTIKDIIDPHMLNADDLALSAVTNYVNAGINSRALFALIHILSDNFFDMSTEQIESTLNIIQKNDWFINFCNGGYEQTILNRDLVYQYMTNIIPIHSFITDIPLKDDIVIDSFLNNRIKDSKLLNKFFLLPLGKICDTFDYDIDKLMQFIGKIDYVDQMRKEEIVCTLINRSLDTDGYVFIGLELLKNNYQAKYPYALTDETINEIIETNLTNPDLTEDNIEYLLNQENFILHEQFKRNCKYYLAKVFPKSPYLIMPFDEAVNKLSSHVNKEKELSIPEMEEVIYGIMNAYLHEHGIDEVYIQFYDFDNLDGYYDNDKREMMMDIRLLYNATKNNSPQNIFLMLETLFHEMHHAIQFLNIRNDKIGYEEYIMIKERILDNYDHDYYTSNYEGTMTEIGAREHGYKGASKFIKTYLKEIESVLQEFDNSKMRFPETKKVSIKDKVVEFNKLFDKLIAYHSNMLKIYKILKLEYNDEGNRRERDEILGYIGSGFDELIEQILNNPKYIVEEDNIKAL